MIFREFKSIWENFGKISIPRNSDINGVQNRCTLDKLRLKLLERGLVHTVTLKQTECRKKNKKIAAAVYLYRADNDGEWGEIRFDFENGTAEIVKLADWDTIKSNVFAKTAIRYVQSLPEVRMLRSVVVPFESETLGK